MGYSLNSFKTVLNDYLLITVGIALYGMGVTLFLLPYQLSTGGVAGIGALIYYSTGWFEVQYTYLLVNFLLLIAAVKELGWRFCMKTIYGVFLLTFLLWFFQRAYEWMGSPMMAGKEVFMSCLIGAIFEGMGLSICFMSGGSTGGTDIIAAIVNKYKNISLGMVIMLFDIIIISSCYFVFHDIQRVVFGYVLLIVSSITLDYCIARSRQSVEFKIYSRNPKAITKAILKSGRGVTIIDGVGGYTQYERKVIISVVRRREQVTMFRMIKAIDPYCFVTMGNVSGVWGEGFDHIKVSSGKGANKKRKTIVFATNNEQRIAEARVILGDNFEIRSLEDIGCDVNNPLNSDIQSNNAVLRARFVKNYYGFDNFAYGVSLDEEGKHIFAVATGNPEIHECKLQKCHSLEEVKELLK